MSTVTDDGVEIALATVTVDGKAGMSTVTHDGVLLVTEM